MDKKLNIFNFLKEIDKHNYSYIDRIDEKQYSPFLIMKWLSGTNVKEQIISINHLLNPLVFNLSSEHKKLLYYLSCISSNNKIKRYQWKKAKKKPTKVLTVIKEYFSFSDNEANMVIDLLEKNDIINMMKELGYNEKKIKEIKKDLNV